MKPKLVVGNWKMNKSFDDAQDLILDIQNGLKDLKLQTEVVLCPPFVYMELITDIAEEEESQFYAGAQNCSEHASGAYTGEVSAEMLASMGVEFCIVGHSERRKYFGESNATIAQKIKLLLEHDIVPIVCCGELLEERKAGKHTQVVQQQIEEALFGLQPAEFERIIIAYEPVWAIGTGETATPAQAEEMHAFIRSLVEKKYGTEMAYNTYILYGGSCNAKNAADLFLQEDVDGGLIGGASLKADDFIAIIQAGESVVRDN
jgi:triosephosphate isomerase